MAGILLSCVFGVIFMYGFHILAPETEMSTVSLVIAVISMICGYGIAFLVKERKKDKEDD